VSLSIAARKLHFDQDYRETALLRDGRPVTLRLLRATDKELLRRGFERLSPESRYRRFFAAKRSLSDSELAYLTELDGLNHFAIAAVVNGPDGVEDGLGIARFVRSKADARVAEAAVTVVDDWQNKGLGTLLLLRLVAAARERGIERFESSALADNAALRDVLTPLGPAVSLRRTGDELVVAVELPALPSDAVLDARARGAAHQRILSLAARNVAGNDASLDEKSRRF
jgi:GNAT superfamily N-acetyltransferase